MDTRFILISIVAGDFFDTLPKFMIIIMTMRLMLAQLGFFGDPETIPLPDRLVIAKTSRHGVHCELAALMELGSKTEYRYRNFFSQ